MSLKIKILSGFVILSLMLFIAGAWLIYELNFMGSSMTKILDENYKSIQAANSMQYALIEQNNAVLQSLLIGENKVREIIDSTDNKITRNLKLAINNITSESERDYIRKIDDQYKIYKEIVNSINFNNGMKPGSASSDKLFNAYNELKNNINDLIQINDEILYQTAGELETRSNRVIMPGIIALVSALIFTLIFNYLVNYYFVNPIIKITNKVKQFSKSKTPFIVEVETNDEIYDLSSSIQQLCEIASVEDSEK